MRRNKLIPDSLHHLITWLQQNRHSEYERVSE